jgi:hypothetical protein
MGVRVPGTYFQLSQAPARGNHLQHARGGLYDSSQVGLRSCVMDESVDDPPVKICSISGLFLYVLRSFPFCFHQSSAL